MLIVETRRWGIVNLVILSPVVFQAFASVLRKLFSVFFCKYVMKFIKQNFKKSFKRYV